MLGNTIYEPMYRNANKDCYCITVNINDMHIIIAPKSKIKNRKPSVDEEYRLIKIIVRLKMKEL
jgi:hypothetical protein